MTVWMKIDLWDKELPLSIHESLSEMAAHYGVSEKYITKRMKEAKKKGNRCAWIEVEDGSYDEH